MLNHESFGTLGALVASIPVDLLGLASARH